MGLFMVGVIASVVGVIIYSLISYCFKEKEKDIKIIVLEYFISFAIIIIILFIPIFLDFYYKNIYIMIPFFALLGSMIMMNVNAFNSLVEMAIGMNNKKK